MNRTSRIISGVAFLLFGIGWALELAGFITISLKGWWTIFIIIPCFAALFSSIKKTVALTGLGIGILLLLSTRGIIPWEDFWKYILCLVAVLWGLSLIFVRKTRFDSKRPDRSTVKELKQINQDGRQIRQINVNFGKQIFEFAGQQFEGADVQTSFGFSSIDLRNADILDGSIVNIDCSFGGMEIRVGRDICVKTAIETSFAGVESQCDLQPNDAVKTLYIKGKCTFGGIDIK